MCIGYSMKKIRAIIEIINQASIITLFTMVFVMLLQIQFDCGFFPYQRELLAWLFVKVVGFQFIKWIVGKI